MEKAWEKGEIQGEIQGEKRMSRIIHQAPATNPVRTKSCDFGENNCSALHQAPGTQPEQAPNKPEAR